MPELFAVAGRKASLPCNITDPTATTEDTITLILWYKGDNKVPIYTLDSRKGPIERARHFSSTELGTRAYFEVTTDPPKLHLDQIHAEDDGIYKCRTEFKRSRTISYLVRLHVIVPPQEITIMDRDGQPLKNMIGPYDEGAHVTIICQAEGGIPPPSVTWWRDSRMIDDTFTLTSQGYIRNELVLPKLQRKDLLSAFTCEASNTNLTEAQSATVTLDINLKPLDVRITTLQLPLSAGKKIQVECESTGARPKAVLIWYKDNQKLQTAKEKTTENVTTSTLTFVPTAEDNGKILYCKAQNPALKNSAIENGWTLIVYFVPELKLSLGANIQPDNIKEGTDVFFECRVKANPWVTEVRWRFEGSPLNSNTSAGIIVSNHSLVLQKVKKDHRGRYQCAAINSQGEGRSQEVMLKVKFAPVCRQSHSVVHGVARYEAVNVSCEVEADPPDVVFRWSLNNSVDNVEIDSMVHNGTVTTMVYAPKTMLGYGALLCWGQNSIGQQKEPCIIRIIPAGPPETMKNCAVTNQTMNSLVVECEPGYDGGMKQYFHLEVYNSAVEHLQVNITLSEYPVFTVHSLPPSTSFILVLYASNAKGRSNSVALVANTLMPAERRTGNESMHSIPEQFSNFSPLLASLIGIVAVLVVVAIAIIIIMKRQGRDPDKGPTIEENIMKCEIPLKKDLDDIPDSTVESPDIIPNKTDSQVYITDRPEIRSESESFDLFKSKEYAYDYITAVKPKKPKSREDEITYAELVHSDVECSGVTRIHTPTEYAELNFQRNVGSSYPWPVDGDCGNNGEENGYPMIKTSTHKSKESLHTSDTATIETTPL